MKPFTETINHFRLILFLLLIISTQYSFAQGDPWGDESSIFEESNLYMDAYSNTNSARRPIFEDQNTLAGGYLGIGVVKTPTNTNPKGVATIGLPCTPTSPSYPACMPIDSEIIYLIIAGLIFGVYKSRKKLAV